MTILWGRRFRLPTAPLCSFVLFLLLFLTSISSAQTSISLPLIGLIRDSTGHTRRVFGTSGAFILGPPEATQAPDRRIPPGIRLEKSSLVIRMQEGQEKRVPLPGPAGHLESMADGWLWAAPFVIRLTADGAQIFRLPAAEAAR